jgi:hydroxylaminobenzene mutase
VDLLLQIGLIELAIGALLGWLMVVREEKPDWLKRAGVVQPHRIRQVHLDFLMMGLILIAVGLVLDDPPTPLAAMLIFGTIVNPSMFIPMAFDPKIDQRLWFRALGVISFIAVSGGLVWAAVIGP